MPTKATAGFTKTANNQKFIRNRDIKLTKGEANREKTIQKRMAEGVCRRCREKVQWRFRYDKYKPLKHPASCQNCKQKVVHKAYRTFCDRCATSKQVCPGCCQTFDEDDSSYILEDRIVADQSNEMEEKSDTCELDDADVAIVGGGEWNEEIDDEGEDEDDIDNRVIDEFKDIDVEFFPMVSSDSISVGSMPGSGMLPILSASEWDERKFAQLAASKYSKDRVVGSEEDTVILFHKP